MRISKDLPTELCEKICLEFVLTKVKELEYFRKIDEAIQSLPPELREKIYKEFVAIKIRERNEIGWNELHNDIEKAPFCEKQQIITKVCYCCNCTSCRINGCCYLCLKKGRAITIYDFRDPYI